MNTKLCPWAALGLGVLSMLLWRWIWASIYDPATQLVAGSGLVELHCAFVLLCGLILVLVSRPRERRTPGPGTFGVPVTGLRVVSALLSAAAGLEMLPPLLAEPSPIPLVLAVLLPVNALALLGLSVAYQPRRRWQHTLILFPVLVSCYWLVAFYHAYGSSPSWVTYLWPMLGGLLVVWSWIAYAGRIYQPKPVDLTLPLALVSILVLGPSLASPLSDGYRLSLLAQLIWFWSVTLEHDPVPAPIRKENSDV